MKVVTAKKASKKSIKNKTKKKTKKRIDFKLDENMKIINAKEADNIAQDAIERKEREKKEKRKEEAKKYKEILEKIFREIIEESKKGHRTLSIKGEDLFIVENNIEFFEDLGYCVQRIYDPNAIILHW